MQFTLSAGLENRILQKVFASTYLCANNQLSFSFCIHLKLHILMRLQRKKH